MNSLREMNRERQRETKREENTKGIELAFDFKQCQLRSMYVNVCIKWRSIKPGRTDELLYVKTSELKTLAMPLLPGPLGWPIFLGAWAF